MYRKENPLELKELRTSHVAFKNVCRNALESLSENMHFAKLRAMSSRDLQEKSLTSGEVDRLSKIAEYIARRLNYWN